MELVERDAELATLSELLEAARSGAGALAMLEAPAGQGKTALLRAVRDRAKESGMRVVSATASPLERDFPFGVVRQLFEAEFRAGSPERLEQLLAGAASMASGVFDTAPDPVAANDVSHAQLNGLFWFTVNLSDEQPLLLVVDDAHWADAPSLRFLAALARRLEDLPVAVAVGARPAEPDAEQDLLDALALAPETRALRPAVLSQEAVQAILTDSLGGEVEAPFAAACTELTGGNALFVRELGRTLKAEGFRGVEREIDAVRATVPPTVTRNVVGRLRRLDAHALSLVRAASVLGGRAELRQVAALAELDGDVAEAHAEAAAVGLLDPVRPRFVHPLVAEAVRSDMSIVERGELHRRAAELLAAEGGDTDAIAGHLMATDPAGEAGVARRLAAAGRRALAGGAPDVAARLLGRALREPPAEGDRPEILLDLGIAETRVGSEEGLGHLNDAAEQGGRVVRARAMVARAGASIYRQRDVEVIDELRHLLDEPEGFEPHLVCRIECGLLNLLPYEDALQSEYAQRIEAGAEAGRAAGIAHLAYKRASGGAGKDEVVALARRALTPARITEEFEMSSSAPYYAIEALNLVEAASESATALRDARAASQRSGSPLTQAWFTHAETAWQQYFGSLAEAVAELQATLETLESTDARRGAMGLIAALASSLTDQGRLDEAEAFLAGIAPIDDPNGSMVSLPTIIGRVHLGRGRLEEALEQFDRQLAFERARGWRISPREHTRTHRVAALAGLGRADEAQEAATEELAFALDRGVAGHEARARLALAALLERDEALEELERAVEAARRSPSRLVQAEALGALGAAQRRGNHRAEARETLREAREAAHLCGATGLEERIHEELVVAGARPQRIALAGIDSLTAAERRVAELAAQGMRNREIAETLFVTLKTVEVHLGRSYSKLDIRGRSQLARALGMPLPAGTTAVIDAGPGGR
jgi:DNA-binding CsgD family transcriptional regulator